jgi:hypothetical protein
MYNSKFADEDDDAEDADADAGLVMSYIALVTTVRFLNNSADFERW